MIQKMRVQTAKGICEYKFLPTAAALQAAADAGEVSTGEEIIYRNHIVLVLEDFNLLILEQINAQPMFNMPPVPDGFGTNGANWTFMVNGVQVDPSQFMHGG